MNVDHAERLCERTRTLSNMVEPVKDRLPYSEFLNTSLAVFLSIFGVTSGSQAGENVLSIWWPPQFHVLMFEVQVESLEKCKSITKAIESKKFEER